MPDASSTTASAKSLIASGRASLGRKDFNQAVADFTQAIRLEPKSSAAFRLRGQAYASKRDFKAAIIDFDQAIALAPKDAEAHYLRGRARHLSGDATKAAADYEAAIRLNPNNLKAFQFREAIAKLDPDPNVGHPSPSSTEPPRSEPLLGQRGLNRSEFAGGSNS